MTHASALALAGLLALPATAAGWGSSGHILVVRAAVASRVPLPGWFREAGAALADLANVPDRWRETDGSVPELAARRSDHYFDLDVWGGERLPPDRWSYVRRAARRRLLPEAVGFLPFALLEEYGALVTAFRDARAGRVGAREAAIASAGILAHFAGDAAVPLHVTRHHHGWVGPNPERFTRAGEVHEWFETTLVRRIDGAQVRAGWEAARPLDDPRRAVETALAESLAAVRDLYVRERDGDEPHARALVLERLDAGATLLARLWGTAWRASAQAGRPRSGPHGG